MYGSLRVGFQCFWVLLSEYKRMIEYEFRSTPVRRLLFLAYFLILLGKVQKKRPVNFRRRIFKRGWSQKDWKGLVGAVNKSHTRWEMWDWIWDLHWLCICIHSVFLLPETGHSGKVWLCYWAVHWATGRKGPVGRQEEGVWKSWALGSLVFWILALCA